MSWPRVCSDATKRKISAANKGITRPHTKTRAHTAPAVVTFGVDKH